MSAKSKKRLCKLENKLQKLEQLELKDVVCSICQSILIEPVTLPCLHCFCQRCFNGSIENNALCCPLCRLRIGSWLRTATKQNNLVNTELWNYIQTKFSKQIDIKLKGDDVDLPEEIPTPRLSAPGEIRSEYEAELQKMQAERLQQEQKHIQETQLLIKKIQQEEQEAQRQYFERLKQDELLAKQIQNQEGSSRPQIVERKRRKSLRETVVRPKLKATKIDCYLAKIQAPIAVPLESPLLTDDNTSTDSSSPKRMNASGSESSPKTMSSSTSKAGASLSVVSSTTKTSVSTTESSSTPDSTNKLKAPTEKPNSKLSPEMVPSYGKQNKNLNRSTLWNKENGEDKEEKNPQPIPEDPCESLDDKKQGPIKSLLVSLPLPNSGVLQHKTNVPKNRTASVDSMGQELCFFKPIEKTSPTSRKTGKCLPLRVPGVRARRSPPPVPPPPCPPPSRAEYLSSFCKLRNLSLANNLPSAFVVALDILKRRDTSSQNNAYTSSKRCVNDDTLRNTTKKIASSKKTIRVSQNNRLNNNTNLRRTRSMGSIVKDENEKTPKKSRTEERKAASERKPHLRSDSKKMNARKELESPPLVSKTINNNKVNLAVKNLSSPIKNCDVKKILQEQLRIEKMIEQEKKDLELARQMDAEWNGRRQLRRASAKRQVTLTHALRPTKKLKV